VPLSLCRVKFLSLCRRGVLLYVETESGVVGVDHRGLADFGSSCHHLWLLDWYLPVHELDKVRDHGCGSCCLRGGSRDFLSDCLFFWSGGGSRCSYLCCFLCLGLGLGGRDIRGLGGHGAEAGALGESDGNAPFLVMC